MAIQSKTASRANRTRGLGFLVVAGAMILSGCGGSSSGGSGNPSSPNNPLTGNWQFTVQSPADQSFTGGVQGGFLVEKGGAITGGAVYSVLSPPSQGGNPTVCNSGSASITGTTSGQNVMLTAVAGGQTFTFSGTLSSDGKTMTGTYASTAGAVANGAPCGTVQSGLQWSAVSVPPLTGPVQGSFHSTGGAAGLNNQNFLVMGNLTEGDNIGASNATLTGNLTFVIPPSKSSDYPCFNTASVNGQISGSSVSLQIIASSGSVIGQIGGTAGSGVNTVSFDSTPAGYILHSAISPAYAVNTKSCSGASIANAGDSGSLCLAFSPPPVVTTVVTNPPPPPPPTACTQPVTLTPASITFPSQLLGAGAAAQSLLITNSDPSGATLSGLSLSWQVNSGAFDNGAPSDFNGLANFTEADTCAPSFGSAFSLDAGQSCTVRVAFSPQESCPWLPFGSPASLLGAAPVSCPFPLSAALIVHSPSSADNNTTFSVPVKGFGASLLQPSTPELDFSSEAVSESTLPQLLSFTNFSAEHIQILGASPCLNPAKGHRTLPHPLDATSNVAGLQVVSNGLASISNIAVAGNSATITYNCDSDSGTLLPNFQISEDSCTGTLLAPLGTCNLQITYAPQPTTVLSAGLDYFLELNTVQCVPGMTIPNCEIDSGRFPVELKANPPSPLRLSPAANLNFGLQGVKQIGIPQTITILNDPNVPDPQTINFVGKVVVTGNYIETDDCGFSLAPGSSCTLTVTFVPSGVGFQTGSITINYTPEPTGVPQVVYLRGTGQ